MSSRLFLLRLPLILAHLITGATLALAIVALSRCGRRPSWIAAVVRWWHRRLCAILGLRIRLSGQLAPGCLLIANHISWLDIPIIGAQGEIGFLAKAQIRDWPLIGWLAEIAGTHFIERGANRIQDVSAALREDLGQGRTLMIFPEGTTSDGTRVLRFHPRLFALAQETGLAIQPIALAYRQGHGDMPDTIAPFVGDDTLVAHLLRVIRHPDLVADIRFLPPIAVTQQSQRRVLAETSRRAIVASLGMPEEIERSRTPAPRVNRCPDLDPGQSAPIPKTVVAHAT